jgi:hypothetical protein
VSVTNAQSIEQIDAPQPGIDDQQQQDSAQFVLSRSENGVITLGGRLHRVFMLVDDGASRNGFFMDSDQGPSMLRVDVSNEPASGWTLSGTLEVGIQSNRAFRVSQDDPNPGTDIQVRDADIHLESEKFGRFSLGRGLAAAWVVSELDLSGTVPAALLATGTLAPGMKFVDRSTNELSSIQVSQHFVDTERLLLVDRFRYDSPTFGGGLQLSGTLAADERWDAALRYYPSLDDWSVRAAATYQHKPFRDVDDRVDLGLSTRHNETGLSLTGGISWGSVTDGRDAAGYVIKGGWLTDLTSLGYTAFSIDYTGGSDVILDGDKSDSFGLFALQKWDSAGLDLYVGYRRYEVMRPDIDLRPLNVLASGVMFTF